MNNKNWSISIALRCTALAFPFASYVVQEALLAMTGLHLRSGDAAIQWLWTAAVGTAGLLAVVPSVYRALRAKQSLTLIKSGGIGLILSLALAALELWSHEADRFCGVTEESCGQWQ